MDGNILHQKRNDLFITIAIMVFKYTEIINNKKEMQSLCGPQIVPPTEKAAKYVLILKGLLVIQFLIAIVDMIAVRSFLREGIFGLFFLFLIFTAFYRLSYHAILIYTFISIFFSVVFLVYILTMYLIIYISVSNVAIQ